MKSNNQYCSVCGKQKEEKFIEFANITVYVECECEKALREAKEKTEMDFALKTAIKLRNKSSHIAPVNQKSSFSTMVVDSDNEKGVKAGKYVLDILLNDKTDIPKNSLVLQGNRGSGKTFVASAVINDFNSKYPVSEACLKNIIKERNNCFSEKDFTPLKSPVKFINEIDLFTLYYENFNYYKTNGPLEEFKRANKLLVIDDVGASDFEPHKLQALYYNVLEYRHSNNLPLILTTNLSKSELCEYIGDRAFDRLRACSYFVDLTSKESRR